MDNMKIKLRERGGWDCSSSTLQTQIGKFDLNNMNWHSSAWNKGFSGNLWSLKDSSAWSEQLNQFYDLGNAISKATNAIVIDAIKTARNEIEEAKEIRKTKYFCGEIVFSYEVDINRSFRSNWDYRVKEIKNALAKGHFIFVVDDDDAEYYPSINRVKSIIKFERNRSDISTDKELAILFSNILNFNNENGITIENIYLFDSDGLKRSIFNKVKFHKSKPTEAPTTPPVESEKEEQKIVKIIDETKKRFNKRTFEIVKKITEIDDIPVNCLIVKQIRGDRDRKRYTLNQNDGDLLGIEYRDNLEILPGDLAYENVYKKVKK